MEIKLKIMTVYVQTKMYHIELLRFMLSIQALLLWCRSVRVSQTAEGEESIAKYL